MDSLLLQHDPRAFRGLGRLTMALLLSQRGTAASFKPSYVPPLHPHRVAKRIHTPPKSRPAHPPPLVRGTVQLPPTQRMALCHLRDSRINRRRCRRSILDLDTALKINHIHPPLPGSHPLHPPHLPPLNNPPHPLLPKLPRRHRLNLHPQPSPPQPPSSPKHPNQHLHR